MNTVSPIPVPLEEIREASHHYHQVGATTEQLTAPIEALLLHQITHQPRSLQKRIGPSELGTPCDHCLAAKLACWQQTENGIPWASTVGTAIHELLEDFVWKHNLKTEAAHPRQPFRYFTEQTITVGTIGDTPITGSIDLLDVLTGSTVDWKCVAKTSLDKYRRNGPSQTYRVQAHLYAKGCNDAGIPVERVSICFLPRASNNFYERHWWSEPYDPQIAANALTRANQLNTNLEALAGISLEVRDQWISSLPRDPACWDCARYPDNPTTPTTSGGVLLDLNNTTK